MQCPEHRSDVRPEMYPNPNVSEGRYVACHALPYTLHNMVFRMVSRNFTTIFTYTKRNNILCMVLLLVTTSRIKLSASEKGLKVPIRYTFVPNFGIWLHCIRNVGFPNFYVETHHDTVEINSNPNRGA